MSKKTKNNVSLEIKCDTIGGINSRSPKFRQAVDGIFQVLDTTEVPLLTRVKAISHLWDLHTGGGIAAVPSDADLAMLSIITRIKSKLEGLTKNEAMFVVAEIMDRSEPIKMYQALGEDGWNALAAENAKGGQA